jgi:hypothetical protein
MKMRIIVVLLYACIISLSASPLHSAPPEDGDADLFVNSGYLEVDEITRASLYVDSYVVVPHYVYVVVPHYVYGWLCDSYVLGVTV